MYQPPEATSASGDTGATHFAGHHTFFVSPVSPSTSLEPYGPPSAGADQHGDVSFSLAADLPTEDPTVEAPIGAIFVSESNTPGKDPNDDLLADDREGPPGLTPSPRTSFSIAASFPRTSTGTST